MTHDCYKGPVTHDCYKRPVTYDCYKRLATHGSQRVNYTQMLQGASCTLFSKTQLTQFPKSQLHIIVTGGGGSSYTRLLQGVVTHDSQRSCYKRPIIHDFQRPSYTYLLLGVSYTPSVTRGSYARLPKTQLHTTVTSDQLYMTVKRYQLHTTVTKG